VSARKTRKIRCHWNGGPIFETKRQETTNAPTTVIEPLGARNVMSETIDDAFAQMGTGGLEPFDEEYGIHDYTGKKDPSPYPRVNRIRRRVFDAAREVEEHRALLVTEAYKAYEADTAMLKCAKAVAHLYRNIPLHIWPEELIVGEVGSKARCVAVYPEYSYEWVADEVRGDRIKNRTEDRYDTSEATKQHLLEIEDFWRGRTVFDEIVKLLDEEELKGSTLGRPVFTPNLFLYAGHGHTMPFYQSLLAGGFAGKREQIHAKLAEIDVTQAEDIEKREFYNAMLIVLDGARDLVLRYAAIARDQERADPDHTRRKELLTMADGLEWISEKPPRTFWEALQLMHLVVCLSYIEGNGQGINYGRFDQELYPFYERDMKDCGVTKAFVAELIECWCIKAWEMLKLRDEVSATLSSEGGYGSTTTVGGVNRDGLDATNDLSYLLIEAHAHTQLQEPWVAVRWHENSPWEYKVKIANVIRMGTGQPKVFNDDAIIPAQMGAGKSLQDSRDYGVIGCVELDVPGKEFGAHDSAYMSLPKVLEMAMNDGRCIDCGPGCGRWSRCGGIGGRLGPQYGGLADFKSFEELKEAYGRQMEYWVEKMVTFINATEIAHRRVKPLPFLSLVKEGPIDKGKDVLAGGSIYNFSGPQGVGMATVGDSLSALRELVFKEKSFRPEELLDALHNNWVGHEALYHLVNSRKIPHYGNDDDYADELTVFAAKCWTDAVHRHQNSRGGKINPGMFCVSANVGIGMWQAATPDGRRAYEPVSNNLGPVHTKLGCHDFTGPTAMAASAGKIDQMRANNGTLLNVRFSPNCVAGEIGRDNLVNFIDTYFRFKGFEVQFNIVDQETLLDAQEHPENYQGLLVRVAGYSALFVRLSKELQDDLIGRNMYDSF
jgi:pyruvate formate-lyase/glycerol dehydratase family glycyl radical enzyme